jgi:hypothetical protein
MKSRDVGVRTVKVMYIGYVAAIYFALAMVVAAASEKITGSFDHEQEALKSTFRIGAETFLHIWVIGVITYIVRNLVELIPFLGLDGAFGFDRFRIKELSAATVFVFVLLRHQEYLSEKMKLFYRRITEKHFL